MFAHVHKSGGSTLCELAEQEGERFDAASTFCGALRYWDSFSSAEFPESPPPKRRGVTCADRATWASESSVTWNSMEHELCEGDLCLGDFIYGTVLRETLARLESQLNYDGRFKVFEMIQCIESSDASACPEQRDRKRTYTFFDNFLVRTFAGCDAMNAPPGKVTRAHYERALEVLEQFDFVIPLSNISSSQAQDTMNSILGWHVPEGTASRVNEHTKTFGPDQVASLTKINSLDIELTNHYFSKWGWRLPPATSDVPGF